MVFNPTRNYAFSPEFRLGDSNILQTTNTHKILGLKVQNDFGWGEQILQMTKKASKTIWLLRRMKQVGIDEKTIVSSVPMFGLVESLWPRPGTWPAGLEKNIFFLNSEILGIQIWRKKRVNYDKFEIATKLNKSNT